MSRQRSSFTGRLIVWAVLAFVLWLIITGKLPHPTTWFK